MDRKNFRLLFSVPVIVAALGYFVDIYDLLLFSIVRRASLISLGVAELICWHKVSTSFVFKWPASW
jgi:hypothetical protein